MQGQKQPKVVGHSAKVVGNPANATELNTSQLIKGKVDMMKGFFFYVASYRIKVDFAARTNCVWELVWRGKEDVHATVEGTVVEGYNWVGSSAQTSHSLIQVKVVLTTLFPPVNLLPSACDILALFFLRNVPIRDATFVLTTRPEAVVSTTASTFLPPCKTTMPVNNEECLGVMPMVAGMPLNLFLSGAHFPIRSCSILGRR